MPVTYMRIEASCKGIKLLEYKRAERYPRPGLPSLPDFLYCEKNNPLIESDAVLVDRFQEKSRKQGLWDLMMYAIHV